MKGVCTVNSLQSMLYVVLKAPQSKYFLYIFKIVLTFYALKQFVSDNVLMKSRA